MKKELGKWLMDVAKYSVTAGLLSYWFRGIEGWERSSYLLAIVFVFVLMSVGLIMVSDKAGINKNQRDNNNKNYKNNKQKRG